MIWLIIVLYLGSGFVISGYTYAYFQRQYSSLANRERFRDGTTALFGIVAGPLSIVSLVSLF